MKTENEIIALDLVERQKLWVELKAVPTSDKDFANAKAIIIVIEDTEDWEAPEKSDAVAKDNCIVDGKSVKKGETIEVYPWQFNALRRFLDDPKEAEERKAKKSKKADGAAALLIFAFLFAFGLSVQAQTQTYVIGGPGTYNVVSVAGLYGGTNNVFGTNTSFGVAVTTTNSAIVPNWSSFNGVWTNTSTTNVLSIATNTPGIVSLANMDMADITFGFALNGAGTGTGFETWDYSDDLVFWRTNALQINLAANGQNYVQTNVSLTLFANGYIRLNSAGYPSQTVALTNLVTTVAKKPGRTGP
jgi:hypothetical protein